MHYLVGLILIVASLFSTVALADDAEGNISGIDRDNDTITLDDGNIYKLPQTFDHSVLAHGMKVSLIYDLVNNTRVVTDIQRAV
ncbi:MAG: DUF1344 domain-containing protein [Rhizobiales bacterium]|nr:DUF1344 domain-containing protein [Hyphomicrobiales bacterium]OJY06478.1 MAG: hypothetical protein BGP07_15495 [Rhizobiales bacterium 63-22]